MIDQDAFKALKEELETFDQQREQLIGQSRKLNSLAKQGMYHVHRGELDKAEVVFGSTRPLADELKHTYQEDWKLKIGAVTASLQEWCECYAYYVYAKEGRLIGKDETGLETEDYLLALADMTGELVRKAVSLSIEKKTEDVKQIRTFLEELYGSFLQFNFRNGELRKKTDAIRWHLQKVEELLVKQA
jgi:predicted translin family RNA/ssDNA-binding protein